MARCQGVISTAGFECMAEALYLGKPLLMVPIRGHFEQHCNVTVGRAAGVGLAANDFAIDRLIRFLPAYQHAAERFRTWVARAEARFIGEIERVVRHTSRVVRLREAGAGLAAPKPNNILFTQP